MSKFNVGDKVICFEEDPFKLLEEGQVYTIDTVGRLSVTLKEVEGYWWFPQRFRLVSKQQYECPYAVIEELQAHVETLEEALEKATKELLELREKVNPSTETSFKPIADMTLEDWQQALGEGWVFADNRFSDPNTVESIVGTDIYFDQFTYPFDIKGVHTEEPEEYQIIKRIK